MRTALQQLRNQVGQPKNFRVGQQHYRPLSKIYPYGEANPPPRRPLALAHAGFVGKPSHPSRRGVAVQPVLVNADGFLGNPVGLPVPQLPPASIGPLAHFEGRIRDVNFVRSAVGGGDRLEVFRKG